MIFSISFNYLDYLNLHLDMRMYRRTLGKKMGGSKVFSGFTTNNLSLSEIWEDLGGEFLVPVGLNVDKVPDITIWNSATFGLSEKAYTTLKEALTPFGEFLPVTIDDQPYFIFNCLNVVEADESVSEADIQDGIWQGVKKLGFKDNTEQSNLVFKTDFDRCSTLYCGEEFKKLIEDNDLQGLSFHENLLYQF